MNAQPLRVISVGVGGRARQHLNAQVALPDKFEIVGLVDIVPEAFGEALEISGLPESACFTTLTEALAATPCDAVGVFTPGHLHTSYMEEAIAAGKHVIVEKPFTCDLAEAERVVAAAEANDVKVVVTQNDRLFHPYPLLREMIADRRYGELGAITMVHHNARGRPFENGYPPMHLWHQGSHQIDSLLSLVQRPPRCVWGVNATPANSNWTAEPHVCAIITFDGPVIVSYTATSDAQAYEMYLRLEFSEAAVTVHGLTMNSTDFVLKVTPRQPLERYPRSEVFPIGKAERGGRWADIEQEIWDGFWSHVMEGHDNLCSGRNNLQTIGVLDAIIRSSTERIAVEL